MPTADLAAIDAVLARAVVYRTLSLGFQTPTDERCRQIGALDEFRALASALRHLDQQAGKGHLEPLAARLASASGRGVETLARSFWRLFGHTTRGAVCACETEYGSSDGFHQPQQLADISGYYLAFGLKPLASSEVRPDHIACECEFMDFLSRKEALLLASRRTGPDCEETLEVTRQAARTFLRDHLGRFGRAFATRVIAEEGEGYFGDFGWILLRFLEAECARVGVESGPADLVVRADLIDETPMACGTADELIQIQRRPP